MTKKTTPPTLSETEIVSNRRVALRSMVARTGLGLAAVTAATAATATPAQAQRRSDGVAQTDRDPRDRARQTDRD